MRRLDLAVDLHMFHMNVGTLWLQAEMLAAHRARIHSQMQRTRAAQHTPAQPSTESSAYVVNSCSQPAPCHTDAAMDLAAAAVALVPAEQSSASAPHAAQAAAALELGSDLEGRLRQWEKQHHSKHWDSLKEELASMQRITVAVLVQCCEVRKAAYLSGSAEVKQESIAFAGVLAPCVLAVLACCREPHQTTELVVVGAAAYVLILAGHLNLAPAALEAVTRCVPITALADPAAALLFTAKQVLNLVRACIKAGVLLSGVQVQKVAGMVVLPQVSIDLDGAEVLGCVKGMHSLFYKEVKQNDGRKSICKTWLGKERSSAMQPLIELFVAKECAKLTSPTNLYTLADTSADLHMSPLALMQHMEDRQEVMQKANVMQAGMVVKLTATTGYGQHDATQQGALPCAEKLMGQVTERLTTLCSSSKPKNSTDAAVFRRLAHYLAFVNPKSEAERSLLLEVMRLGAMHMPQTVDASVFQLWTAQERCKTLGLPLPYLKAIADAVDAARADTLPAYDADERTRYKGSRGQQEVREVAAGMVDKGMGIDWVSQSEHRLKGPAGLWCVDMLLDLTKGPKAVVEFEGEGHDVWPVGGKTGSSFFRNEMLTHYGYLVVMVTEREWRAAQTLEEKEQLLLTKIDEALRATAAGA
jgi:hypothetical protein